MFSIQKILVPTDFSDNAACAYEPAQQIASRYGATIDFIHVIPTLLYFRDSLEQLAMPLDMEEDVYPHAKGQATKQVQELMNEHLNPKNKGDALVHIGSKPSKAITDYATQEGYDLIAIASKGGDESNLLRGSTTERIIRYSELPVLHTANPMKQDLEKILLPTDGSQTSLQALPMAISIAHNYNADIRLLNIIELLGTSGENIVKYVPKNDATDKKEAIYRTLDNFLTETQVNITHQSGNNFDSQFLLDGGKEAINVRTVIEKGISAHKAITDYGNNQADLTVMATHGHSGFEHLLLGSTTEKVARHLQGPVLTVKPDFVSRSQE